MGFLWIRFSRGGNCAPANEYLQEKSGLLLDVCFETFFTTRRGLNNV
jgi:hypothetical protein